MEKTLLEIINDGLNYKVYEDKENGDTVHMSLNNRLVFTHKSPKQTTSTLIDTINLNKKYKLQRKQYIFQEAFKAYEEGKEIENVNDGRKLKKAKNGTDMVKYKNWSEWKFQIKDEFALTINDIRDKWYINN